MICVVFNFPKVRIWEIIDTDPDPRGSADARKAEDHKLGLISNTASTWT